MNVDKQTIRVHKVQESIESRQGFDEHAKRFIVNRTPTELQTPSRGTQIEKNSSVHINIERNNFESGDLTRKNDEFYLSSRQKDSLLLQSQEMYKRHNIDIMSLDDSLPRQISVFKVSERSTDYAEDLDHASPELLKMQNLGAQIKRSDSQHEEDGKDGAISAKTYETINVIARVRPQIPNEVGHPICIEVVDDSVVNGVKTQIVVRQGFTGASNSGSDQKLYRFEKVLDPESSQKQVFTEVEGHSLCNAFLNGQNCTIFVYGPTSTGKTYTMQGNAEDIIHGNVPNIKSMVSSINASPEQSNISHVDESMMTNDFEMKNFTPIKSKGQFSVSKRPVLLSNISQVRPFSNSFHGAMGSGKRDEDSPQRCLIKNSSISKVARDMMIESRDKGIIQRIIDQVFEKFSERQDLDTNCEVRISFLEIYKDQVTDLLEGHQQPKAQKLQQQRNHSSSFAVVPLESKIDADGRTHNSRSKAKTFYGEENLEDIVNKKRSNLDLDQQSLQQNLNFEIGSASRRLEEKNNGARPIRYGSVKEILPRAEKKQYKVLENAIKGVYVQNLAEIVCETPEQAYHCLLDGLMRKRMSQTVRNTSSSRSHTIFQIKMYMKPQNFGIQLLPQYLQHQEADKLISKFSLVDLAGSERIMESEKNQERIDEARFINKSLSALGNVVAALRTQAKQANQQSLDQSHTTNKVPKENIDSRRSSFHNSTAMKSPSAYFDNSAKQLPRKMSVYEKKPASMQHIPFRDSKLTHILKDCLGSNSFTHLIICLSPSQLCLPESISTLAFTKNAKAVRQNIVENVQFKSDLINRATFASVLHGPHTTSHRPAQKSLLSQMAGNHDDEVMIKDLLGELGASSLHGMDIKQFFSMTLEALKQFKEIKEKHDDMSVELAQIKKAINKDLSNPHTREILSNAHQSDDNSNYGRKTPNNDHSSWPTPMSVSSDSNLFGIKQNYSASNYASAAPVINQHNYRNNTLKSISEEDHSASITSPLGGKELSGNGTGRVSGGTGTASFTVKKPVLVIESSISIHRKMQSTTSVLTFGGNNLDLLTLRNRQSDGLFQKNLSSNSFINGQGDSKNNQNSCETNGGHAKEQDSVNYVETEPAEVNDESTPCGCLSHQPQNLRFSLIPQQNLERLQQSYVYNTMRSVITQTLKNCIRQRIIIESIRAQGKKKKDPKTGKHARQKSYDEVNLRNMYISSGNKTKKAGVENFGKIEPQQCINQGVRTSMTTGSKIQGNPHYGFEGQNKNDHFTEIDRAGMAYFMPKLLKSSSCPNYPNEVDKTSSKVQKKKCIVIDDQNPAKLISSEENPQIQMPQLQKSREIEISDIYSDDSDTYPSNQGGGEKVEYQSQEKKDAQNATACEEGMLTLNKGDHSDKRMNLIRHLNQSPEVQQEMSPGKISAKFEQSQGRMNNLFENSRFSGTNSLKSHSLVQSHSQKFINRKIGGKNSGKGSVGISLLRPAPFKLGKTGKIKKAFSMPKYAMASSQLSIRSNDIPKVQEVNDNQISSEDFQRIRKSNNTKKSSVRSDQMMSDFQGLGPLIFDQQLKPQLGSTIEPRPSKSAKVSVISSIKELEQNSTFITNSIAKNIQQPMVQPTAAGKDRVGFKTFITELNKSLPKKLGSSFKAHDQLLKPTSQTYQIPIQLTGKNKSSYLASQIIQKPSPTQYNSAVRPGVPMTQQIIKGPNMTISPLIHIKVLDQYVNLPQFSTPGTKSPASKQSQIQNSQKKPSILTSLIGNNSMPNKFPNNAGNTRSMQSILKPNKPGASAVKLSKPLAGCNPDGN